MENSHINKIKTIDLNFVPKYKLNSPKNICTTLKIGPNSPKKPNSPKRLKPKKNIDATSPILKHIEHSIITKFKLEDEVCYENEDDDDDF
tara:strand:+ start:482 stop:751 length:270 start_codon:yes stop_codon:yes gene_type:complete